MANNQSNDDQGNQGRSGKKRSGSKRGFASMSADKQRAIASKGGRAAHQKGTAHEWNSKEAAEAGRAGGRASQGNRGNRSGSKSTE